LSTQAKCGTGGSTGFGGEVKSWTFTEDLATLEATSMDSAGNKEYIGCLKSGSGSFESYTLAATIGAQTAATFICEEHTYTADIIITNITTTVDVQGLVVFKFDFETTGEIS